MSGAMFISLTTAGLLTSQMWPYNVATILTGIYQVNQIRSLNLDNPEDCWRAFDRQKYIGFLILGGVLVSVSLKARHNAKKEDKDLQARGDLRK